MPRRVQSPPPLHWSGVILTEEALRQPVPVLERDFRRRVPEVVCWFPAAEIDLIPATHPLASYVFLRDLPPDRARLLERSSYVDGLLRAGKEVAVLTDKEVRRMLQHLLAPEPAVHVGEEARIARGRMQGLRGVVAAVSETSVELIIALYSGDRHVTVPLRDLA